MKSLVKRLARVIGLVLTATLFVASSRTPYAASARINLRDEGKRPKPSRQDVPSNPLRAVAQASKGALRSMAPSPTMSELRLGATSHRSSRWVGKESRLACATSRPEYLKAYTPAELHSYLSPPL
jgi:hypothetical protein